ncbi:MAG TPA: glycosyltransferase [Ktedonobacteraceae bacterium]|nr:glycosyltransferase [Ktedonobacteraceae bacterium]
MPYSVAMLSIHTSPLDTPGRTKDAGGMNVYMRQLAQELAQNAINVDIFTRWTDERAPQIVPLNCRVRVIHIKAGPRSPVHKNDLHHYTSAFARNIEEFRRSEGRSYDIIHSHYWLSGIAAMQLACAWDVPHVTMFHTLGRLKQEANPHEQEPSLRLEMEQRLIQRADRIIAATADERVQVIRLCGASASKVEVVPCGVDLKLFVPHDRHQAREYLGVKSERPVLLFAGRLDPFKGPDVLLRAAAMMEQDAQVVIVGGKLTGDKDLQQLQALARELKISARVKFLGARPQEELPIIYSAADVMVMPSYHESFGLAAVEALACGTPVVATRAGGLTTIVRQGETGFLVPRCPGFFAERLDLLLKNATVRADMSAAARNSVLQFSWKKIASQMSRVYGSLIRETESLVV